MGGMGGMGGGGGGGEKPTHPIQQAVGYGMMASAMLSKLIIGEMQRRKGEKLKKALVRPVYEAPNEAKEIGRLTAMRYMNPELAGQRQIEEGIGLSTANTIEAAKDFGSSGDIYKAQINENNATNEIGVKAAQQRLSTEAQRIEGLQLMSDYADKKFDYNINIPYQERRQEALSLINAGAINRENGINMLAEQGAMVAGSGGGSGAGGKSPVDERSAATPTDLKRGSGADERKLNMSGNNSNIGISSASVSAGGGDSRILKTVKPSVTNDKTVPYANAVDQQKNNPFMNFINGKNNSYIQSLFSN